jgi:hypothetical protein
LRQEGFPEKKHIVRQYALRNIAARNKGIRKGNGLRKQKH